MKINSNEIKFLIEMLDSYIEDLIYDCDSEIAIDKINFLKNLQEKLNKKLYYKITKEGGKNNE